MKKYLYVCILFFSFCCVSCFEDESSLSIRNLNPIRIENIELDGSYAVYMGDTLNVEPLVFCEGVPDAELSFEWQLSGYTIVPTILDSTMYMSAQIVAPPATNPYLLKFTVTDNTTGIARIEQFNVSVQSPYGPGLIVVDTKDGLTSDLSLIRSREFTSEIPSDDDQKRIFRHVWSQNNGAPLDGLVLDLITNSYGTNRSMTILTTEHILRADYTDYVNMPEEQDENMFLVKPTHIGNGSYTHGLFSEEESRGEELMSVNGLLTMRSQQQGNRHYGYTLYPVGILDYDVTMMYNPEWCPVYCYDALGERMLFYSGGVLSVAEEQVSDSKFDVNDLSDYEPFLLDEISSGIVLLTKQKSTGTFIGLVMDKLEDNGQNFAKSTFDFSSAMDIDQALFFDVNASEDVIYYATESKLYAVPIANMSAAVQWEVQVGSGDEITGIKVYDFETGGYCLYQGTTSGGDPTDSSQPSSRRMMMIFTYNDATQEGKITCVPITNLGRGSLEKNRAYHVTFPGFNKITGVYCQQK